MSQFPPNPSEPSLQQQMPPQAQYPGEQHYYQPLPPQQPYSQPLQQPYQQGYPAQQPMYVPPVQPVVTNIMNVNVGAQKQGPGGCARALYFVFVGWWLGFFALNIGFFLVAIIVTIPVGLMIINRIPQIMTLKPVSTGQTSVNVTTVSTAGANVNMVSVNVGGVQQHSFLVRALYFCFVGCWLGYIWALLAYGLCATIIGLPVGIMMFDRLPAVLTLRKN